MERAADRPSRPDRVGPVNNAPADGPAQLALDLWRIVHRSLLLDLRIPAGTIGMVVFGERLDRRRWGEPMRAVLIGAVDSTRIALRALAGAVDWTIAAVVTLPPALAARHSDFVDLADDAHAAGVEIIRAEDCNAPEVVAAVAAAAPISCSLSVGRNSAGRR